jgi:hypothetical protein
MLIAANGRSRRVKAMADPSDRASQVYLLVFDGQCRLCVIAKKGLEGLETHVDATSILMVPY